MRKKLLITLLLLFSFINIFAQNEKIYLWKDVESMSKQKSRLYIYLAPDSIRNGTAIIVCPGGSYHHLGMPHEGFQVAEWLNSIGVSAFVLRYRVSGQGYHHPAMIQDIQRAIQYVRENSVKLKIDPTRLGVMGFSAGGHLVTMSGVYHTDDYLKKLGINHSVSLRPDFVVPVYPVVSMQDSLAHLKSRKNLLGKNYTEADMDKFSLELHIPDDMPPLFLITAKNDPVVKYQNSVELGKALTNKNIKHTFLLYESGGHGYGMNIKRGGETAKWNKTFHQWLIEYGFIKQ